MPSPVRSERVKNEKHVERKQRSLMKSTYLTRPYDFLLGTKTGQFVLIMAMWIFLVFLGALFFYWAGGSRAMDLGLPNDDFWDSLWASYVLFIDIGTVEIFFFFNLYSSFQNPFESWQVLRPGCTPQTPRVFFSWVLQSHSLDLHFYSSYSESLSILYVVIQSSASTTPTFDYLNINTQVRDKLQYFEALHERIVENDHTIILGWNDKVLFLAEEMAMMMLSTWCSSAF